MVCKNGGIYGFLGAWWVLINMVPRNRVFADNFSWFRFFLVVLFPKIQPLSTHTQRKIICSAGTKKWSERHSSTYTFILGFGLASGWGVRRFHKSYILFSHDLANRKTPYLRGYIIIRTYYGV